MNVWSKRKRCFEWPFNKYTFKWLKPELDDNYDIRNPNDNHYSANNIQFIDKSARNWRALSDFIWKTTPYMCEQTKVFCTLTKILQFFGMNTVMPLRDIYERELRLRLEEKKKCLEFTLSAYAWNTLSEIRKGACVMLFLCNNVNTYLTPNVRIQNYFRYELVSFFSFVIKRFDL